MVDAKVMLFKRARTTHSVEKVVLITTWWGSTMSKLQLQHNFNYFNNLFHRYGWIAEMIAVVPRLKSDKLCGKGNTGVVSWNAPSHRKFAVFCFNSSGILISMLRCLKFKQKTHFIMLLNIKQLNCKILFFFSSWKPGATCKHINSELKVRHIFQSTENSVHITCCPYTEINTSTSNSDCRIPQAGILCFNFFCFGSNNLWDVFLSSSSSPHHVNFQWRQFYLPHICTDFWSLTFFCVRAAKV